MSDIVVDSSALIAILLGEPERDALLGALQRSGRRAASSFTLLETSVVLGRRLGSAAWPELDRLLTALEVDEAPLDATTAHGAREAWAQFGKGRHPAKLNLGDCCSYATAERMGRPLLCKGEDFPRTPLPLVEW